MSDPTPPALPPDVFRAPPAVYAVGKNYCITLIPAARCVVWCRVGNETFYDDFNGVFRSERLLHQVYVPAGKLEKAGRLRTKLAMNFSVSISPSIEESTHRS